MSESGRTEDNDFIFLFSIRPVFLYFFCSFTEKNIFYSLLLHLYSPFVIIAIAHLHQTKRHISTLTISQCTFVILACWRVTVTYSRMDPTFHDQREHISSSEMREILYIQPKIKNFFSLNIVEGIAFSFYSCLTLSLHFHLHLLVSQSGVLP